MGLVLGACGGDDTADTDDATDGGAEKNALTVSVTMEGIEVPDEVEGGIVEVTFETIGEGGDFSFSKVAPGTTEDQFREGIVKAVTGQGVPDFIEANAGMAGKSGTTATLNLPEGDYFVWSIPEPPEEEGEGGEGEDGPAAEAPEGEQPAEGEGGEGGPGGGPPPEAVKLKAVKVTPGEAGNLPDPGDQIIAKDFTFEINVVDGADEILFRNDGPNELHHAVLFNFGDIEASVVEENFEAFLNSEGPDAPPPPALKDVDQEKLEAGNTGVFSPNLGGTSPLEIEAGNTYVVACFIGDKAGGPPHAIAHKMWKVFTA